MKKNIVLIVSWILMGCATNPEITIVEKKTARKTASEQYLIRCYAQSYSESHLQRNPNQLVKKIVVGIYEDAMAADFVRLKFVTTKPLKTNNNSHSSSQVIAESADCDLISPPFDAPYSIGCSLGSDNSRPDRVDFDLKETVVDRRNGNFLKILNPVEVSFLNKDRPNNTLKSEKNLVVTLNLANDPTKGKFTLIPLSLTICEAEF